MKTRLILAFMFVSLLGFSQSEVNQQYVTAGTHTIVDTVDLTSITGADTTYYVILPATDFTWSIDIECTGVTGTGAVQVVGSGSNLTFANYNGLNAQSITSTDTVYKAEDSFLSWYALGVKVTKPSAGTLNWIKLTLKR